jgi:hypothetical protein
LLQARVFRGLAEAATTLGQLAAHCSPKRSAVGSVSPVRLWRVGIGSVPPMRELRLSAYRGTSRRVDLAASGDATVPRCSARCGRTSRGRPRGGRRRRRRPAPRTRRLDPRRRRGSGPRQTRARAGTIRCSDRTERDRRGCHGRLP